jgi:hypothetical protein
MLMLEGYISNFTCVKYYFLYVEFSDSYVNQSLAGQTILECTKKIVHVLILKNLSTKNKYQMKMNLLLFYILILVRHLK